MITHISVVKWIAWYDLFFSHVDFSIKTNSDIRYWIFLTFLNFDTWYSRTAKYNIRKVMNLMYVCSLFDFSLQCDIRKWTSATEDNPFLIDVVHRHNNNLTNILQMLKSSFILLILGFRIVKNSLVERNGKVNHTQKRMI